MKGFRSAVALVMCFGFVGCGEEPTSATEELFSGPSDLRDFEADVLGGTDGMDGRVTKPESDVGESDVGESDVGESDVGESDVGDLESDIGELENSDTVDPEDDGETGDACPLGAPCDDGIACTYDDRCGETGCSGVSYTCDDGLDCTIQECAGDGSCTMELASEACLIGGICSVEGAAAPQGFCGKCDPGVDGLQWTGSDGEACDDGSPCTATDGLCADGLCEAPILSCDDGEICTQDSCGLQGCLHNFLFASCDDGDACTTGDLCLESQGCTGLDSLDCDDGNVCTADSCEEGCLNEATEGNCSDGDFCTWNDLCFQTECIGGAGAVCEDGNSCTESTCTPELGCTYSLIEDPCCTGSVNVCDDGDICTFDQCAPGTGECINEPFKGPCEDGNPCTLQDTCFSGLCLGFTKDCSDGNSCTLDECGVTGVCLHPPLDGGACDDGKECTVDDACSFGVCAGNDSACVCEPNFSLVVNKFNGIQMGPNGEPGSGLDVDENPETCAPENSCSGGIDNALSALASFANDALAESILNGDVIMLLEHDGYNEDGIPFTTYFHIGESAEATCDINGNTCPYWVEGSGYDEACVPVVVLPGMKVDNGLLTGGGKGTQLPIVLPLSETALLALTLYDVQISAEVTTVNGSVTLQGVLGGAVKETDLVSAIEALPEGSFPGGLSSEVVISLLSSLVVADIDINGDGVNEASSIGLPFTAIDGTLVGVLP